MNRGETGYLNLLRKILKEGEVKGDRTGTGTLSAFGESLRFDLSEGFPLLTTKRVHWKSVVGELCWFLEGSGDTQVLEDKYDVNIWRFWPTDGKKYVPYGKLWRFWPTGEADDWDRGWFPEKIDQISQVIEEIKNNPDSRRLVVTAWNPAERENLVLDACHYSFAFNVSPLREGETKRRLNCSFVMRSSDVPIGLPFNIASYALLTHMVAQVCDLDVGELVYFGMDAHIYLNQIAAVEEQLSREPRPFPKLVLNPDVRNIFDFTPGDCVLEGYSPHPRLHMGVAV